MKIIGWCFALFIIAVICMLADMYKKTVIAYRDGDYQVVEGYVKNFDSMPYGGHKEETFEINNVKFGYSDYTMMIGYHNTKSHGGIITGSGQYLKIGYVHYGNEKYNKDDYYMEIERDFSPMAVPHHIIKKAAFLDDKKLELQYHCGKNLEIKEEIIIL